MTAVQLGQQFVSSRMRGPEVRSWHDRPSPCHWLIIGQVKPLHIACHTQQGGEQAAVPRVGGGGQRAAATTDKQHGLLNKKHRQNQLLSSENNTKIYTTSQNHKFNQISTHEPFINIFSNIYLYMFIEHEMIDTQGRIFRFESLRTF